MRTSLGAFLGVANIVLNKPEIHNAFGDVVIAQLSAVMDEVHEVTT